MLSPDSKRYNEIMVYMLSLYFWGVFLTEPMMRSKIVDWLLTRQLSDLGAEFLMDAFLWVTGISFLICTLSMIWMPFGHRPKTYGDREVISTIIITINVVCGIVLTVHQWNRAVGLWHLIPIGNALIILLEFSQDRDDAEDTAEGEANRFHLLLATAAVGALFWYFHYQYQPYWALSLCVASLAVAVFSWLLIAIVPLEPHGARLERATPDERKQHELEVEQNRVIRELYSSGQEILELSLQPDQRWTDKQFTDSSRLILFMGGELLIDTGTRQIPVEYGIPQLVEAGESLEIVNTGEGKAKFLVARQPAPVEQQ